MMVTTVGVILLAVSTTRGTDSEAFLDHGLKQYEEKVVKIGQRHSPVEIKGIN